MATVAQAVPVSPRRPSQFLAAGRSPAREVYFVKRIDNSWIVREVDSSKRRECCALAGMVTLAFALSFAFAWQHFECVRYGYEIEQMRQSESSLAKWNRKLESEEQSLDEEGFIAARAHSELGLERAEPSQVVRVDQVMDGQPAPDGSQFALASANFGRPRPEK